MWFALSVAGGGSLVSRAAAPPASGAGARAAGDTDRETGATAAGSAPEMTLARAIQTAVSNQPTVRQARAATEAAAGRVDQAASGGLPQVTGSAIYQRTTGNFAPRPGATAAAIQAAPPWTGQSYNYFSFGATASQLIYDFGQTSGRRRAAEANREASEVTERTAAFSVRLQVQQAFFRARAQKALIVVARAAVNNQQKHYEQIHGFVGAGMRPEIDLASVRTDLANARVQLITAENGYDMAKAQLNQAMGVFSPPRYDVADDELPPIEGEDAPVARLVDDALARRPEVTALQRQRTAQEHTISSLKGGYGPAIVANAGASEAGTMVDHLVPNWLLGASLSWPLLQGGLTRGQVREAEGNLHVIDTQIDAIRLQVRLDIEQALLAVRAAKATIQAVTDAVASAQEQLALAEGRYRTGLGNAIELSDSQQAKTAAQAQAIQADFNLAAARAQLALALGNP